MLSISVPVSRQLKIRISSILPLKHSVCDEPLEVVCPTCMKEVDIVLNEKGPLLVPTPSINIFPVEPSQVKVTWCQLPSATTPTGISPASLRIWATPPVITSAQRLPAPKVP